MSPAPALYLDNLQSRRDDEPAGRLSVVPLSQVYNFEVVPAVLSAEEGRPVRFRLLLTPLEKLPEGGVPNEGVLRLSFDRSRALTVDELRRLLV